jgi:hypothetical protein
VTRERVEQIASNHIYLLVFNAHDSAIHPKRTDRITEQGDIFELVKSLVQLEVGHERQGHKLRHEAVVSFVRQKLRWIRGRRRVQRSAGDISGDAGTLEDR